VSSGKERIQFLNRALLTWERPRSGRR